MTAYLRIAVIVLSLLIVSGIAIAEDVLQVEISLLQRLPDTSAVPVATDTVLVPLDGILTSRLANVVTDLSVLSFTEDGVDLRIEMITSGPNSQKYFRTFTVPFGIPVIVDSVVVKNGSIFRLLISPLEIVESGNDCEYDPSDPDVFTSDPAPHFQMYFVPFSLGDYHWNSVREYIENEIGKLKKTYEFEESHPINFYMLPCRCASYQYDKLWGFHIDPVKNNVMCVYNHDEKTISSLPTNMLRYYKFWGYAPRFFVEGVSSIPDFNDYYIREYMKINAIPDLSEFFSTNSYFNSNDKLMLRRFAGSFCGYLVRTYGILQFRQFYMSATDLTASADLLATYGKSVDSLMADWKQGLGTLNIAARWFKFYSERLSNLRKYDEAIVLMEKYFAATGGSASQMESLGNYHYLTGNYDRAQEYYESRLSEDGVTPSDLVVAANMMLINGEIDGAREYYDKVISIDSTQAMPELKSGRILQYKGDYSGAIEHYKRVAVISLTDDIVVDAHLGIGLCLNALGKADSAKAYFVSALNGAKRLMVSGSPKPLMYMRAGEAFIYLGQAEAAIEHLEMALFVEERKLYVGRMALAMGQAYDLKGERQTALDYYQMVHDTPGGFLFREDADKYMSEPYSVSR